MSCWKQERVLWTVILALGFQMACGDASTQPSPTSGVIVYQHPDFRGDSYTFVRDFNNLDDLRGPCGITDSSTSWKNCVSSVSIAAGWEAIAFERDDFAGETLTITSDIMDLDDLAGPCGGDWDDCILSIRVFPPG